MAGQHRPRPGEPTAVVAGRPAGGVDEHGRRRPRGARRRPRQRRSAAPVLLRSRHHRRPRLDSRRTGAGRVARRRGEPQQSCRLRPRARRWGAGAAALRSRQQRRPGAGRRRAHGHVGNRGGGVVEGLSRGHGDETVGRPTRRRPVRATVRRRAGPAGVAAVARRRRHDRVRVRPGRLERGVGGAAAGRPAARVRRAAPADEPPSSTSGTPLPMDIDVVFQSGGEIWLWDGDGAAAVEVDLGGERRATMPRPIDASRHLGDHRPGRRRPGQCGRGPRHGVVVDPPRRPGARAGLGVDGAEAAAGRASSPAGDVAWVTDAEGDDAIELWSAADETSRTVADGEVGRVLELVAAPDGSLLAGASHDGRLWVVAVATGELREIDRTDNGDITGLAFAPDSRWLAWSRPGPQPLAQIRLAEVAEPAATPDRRHPAALRRHRAVVQH